MTDSSKEVPDTESTKSKGITPEQIGSAEKIDSNIKLSKDGSRAVYSAGPAYKTGDKMTSAIWVAETGQEGSARQLTEGTFLDHSPEIHPASSKVFFLSDRDGSTQLFSISDGSPQSLVRVTNLDKDHGVASYAISPDGNYVAFIVSVVSKPKKGDKEESITIWREEKKEKYNTLLLIDLREPLVLSAGPRTLVFTEAHVKSFSWSPDSSAIVYRLVEHRDIEANAFPVNEKIISISGKSQPLCAFTYPKMPSSATIWRECGDFVFVQPVEPTKTCSAQCVWLRKAAQTPESESQLHHVAYGHVNDVSGIADLGSDSQYAVQVAEGLTTKFDVYDRDEFVFTAFQTTVDISADGAWDMKLTAEGKYVLVAIRSSGVRGEPENIWSGVTERNHTGVLSKKLSSHNSWFTPEIAPMFEPFYWTGSDGVKLEGVISYPRGVEPKGLPTLVNPHGGPSSRDTLNLLLGFEEWRPYLASHGYLIMSPNYRGGTGRGNDFALAAEGGVGTTDWDDINSMIEAGISRGFVDPQRVGIGGWSQGGFETAWGCTRPGNKFKVGIMGAGVSDWGFLAASSDVPDFEATLGGGAPWTPGAPVYLNGSPLKDVQNVVAPMLIMHGKADARVPVTQAIAFLRGIERVGKAAVNPTLVIYPGAEHDFEDRVQAEDVLRRVLEYVDLYLK
ncbi:alpha/beta-hydrolase [Pholiota conissans]|uniref:Dipeptidyl-peptidase V n=1 Tax=Pholiota conissans TaxID=109636 RepID=A0A9P5YX84_9AGAR|nr:alpha/beta-hydrolase [Pholiota conissans]